MGSLYNVDGTSGNITTAGSITSTSTTSGFQLPSMTTTQRDAIVSPTTGLEIFNTTTNQSEFWNGSAWTAVGGGGTPGGSSGQFQYNSSGSFAGTPNITTDGSNISLVDNNSINLSNSAAAYISYNNVIGGIVLQQNASNNVGGFASIGTIAINANAGPTGGGSYLPEIGMGTNTPADISLLPDVHGSVIVGTPYSGASAILQVNSTTQGFLPPVMTTAQRDAIGTPATGTATVVDYTMLSGATLTVNGTTLTEGTDWHAATDNNTTAASLASAVNTVTGFTGSSLSNVVTITAKVVIGSNSSTLASSDGTNLPVSGATLTGEVDPAVGLNIYNTDTNKDEFYNGTVWGPVSSGGTPGGNPQDVQFNTASAFDGSDSFTWDGSTLLVNNTVRTDHLNSNSTSASVALDTGFIRDTSGTLAIRFGTERLLDDNTQTTSLDWQNRFLSDSASTTVLDWNAVGYVKVAANFGVNLSGSQDASAILEVDSTTQGFLPPRMTTTQKNAIVSPATGLVVYDTTLNETDIYNGTNWVSIGYGNFPSRVSNVALTAQPAAITTTTLFTPTTTGTYRVSVYIVDTAAGSAGTVAATIGWTDDEQAQTTSTSTVPLATLGAFTNATFFIEAISGNAITYATTFVGALGSPQYSLYVTAERLS